MSIPAPVSGGCADEALTDLHRLLLEERTSAREQRRLGRALLHARRLGNGLRCAVLIGDQPTCAWLTLTGRAAAGSGPVIAEIISRAPSPGGRHPGYLIRDVMVAMRMRADRWPEPDRYGVITVKAPGVVVELHGHRLVVYSEGQAGRASGALVVTFDNSWRAGDVAAVADVAMRTFGHPEALHRTWTTQPRGWVHPSDNRHRQVQTSAGLNRPGRRAGLVGDHASWAFCSCGWGRACESRQAARWAAKLHREKA
ncbi:hypothetical protein ACQEVX_04850 [Streptomyces syringium]|uniref:hypothetical protein n=1 Tax=Streptomyces syringium TaxID=76729 RepID=UPI003D9230C9